MSQDEYSGRILEDLQRRENLSVEKLLVKDWPLAESDDQIEIVIKILSGSIRSVGFRPITRDQQLLHSFQGHWVVLENNPGSDDAIAAKNLLTNLRATITQKLIHARSYKENKSIAFHDADWAESFGSKKSITELCFVLNQNSGEVAGFLNNDSHSLFFSWGSIN